MVQYKDLDKKLKKIRRNWEYDLYEVNLESQKIIDQFYNEEISENDMMGRKYQLESYLDRRNILVFPIIITIIFGMLVNIVYNKISSVPNIIDVFQELQTIQESQENINILIRLYILLIFLIVFAIAIFISAFFLPLFPLYASLDLGKNRIYQVEYELKKLEEKINKKLDENKKGKKYEHKIKKKPTKLLIIILALIIVSIIISIATKIKIHMVFVLIAIGIVIGYIVFKLDSDK